MPFEKTKPFQLIILLLLLALPHTASCAHKVFPISTEFQIGKIKPMLERVPEGVYISVGGERSFRGASMAPQVTRVYMLDIAPEIVHFNKINKELLKAPNREAYLNLRWKAPYEEWKKLKLNLTPEDFKWWEHNIRTLQNMNYAFPEILNRSEGDPSAQTFIKMWNKLSFVYQSMKNKETPQQPEKHFIESVTPDQLKDLEKTLNISTEITPEEWEGWTKIKKNKESDCMFQQWFENPTEAVDLSQVVDYKSGNYLFDDKLYAKLHDLAMKENLVIVKIDLTDKKQLEKFVKILNDNKDTIAVLDLNNLYREQYIGDKNYKQIIHNLLVYGKDNSLLLVMNNYKEYTCAEFQIYLGFTFENIVHWPPYFSLQPFFDTLPKSLLDIIDGRVYEKEETPPYQFLLQ